MRTQLSPKESNRGCLRHKREYSLFDALARPSGGKRGAVGRQERRGLGVRRALRAPSLPSAREDGEALASRSGEPGLSLDCARCAR